MNNYIKNILLLVAALVLAYFSAEYSGSLYGYFSPQYDDSMIGLSKEALSFVDGTPFAYIFFTVLLFKLFGLGNKNKWIGWLLVPPFLFFASGDLKHIYLPIIFGLIAFGLATLIQKIFKIDRYTEPSPR